MASVTNPPLVRRKTIAPRFCTSSRSITSAAQVGGACLAVTITAARSQSSAKRLRPMRQRGQRCRQRNCATQPASSHATPSPSVGSPGNRASASAASHSAARRCPCRFASHANARPRRARRRYRHRRISEYPAAASSTAQMSRGKRSPPPPQRSGVRSNPSRIIPAVAASSGPVPNAAMRPIAPGKRRDPLRHHDHPVDAESHQPPEQAVEAERHREQPQQCPPASPGQTPRASPPDWRARRRASTR